MEVEINFEKCIGCGSCQAICPEVFEVAEDGKAHVIGSCTDKDCCRKAAEACPTKSISIRE